MKFPLPIVLALCLAMLLPTVSRGEPGAEETAIEMAVCSVCRVHGGESDPEPVVATADFQGETYGFCSDDCRDEFVEDPAGYLPPVFPRPALPFTVQDLEGESFASSDLEGRIVLLDFWATWCQPCVNDLPRLTELHERYAERGVSVVSVSIDEGEKAPKKVSRMVAKREARHPVYLDSSEALAWAAYGVKVVPTQFLINADGNVVAQWSGAIDLDVVEAEIIRLLAEPAAASSHPPHAPQPDPPPASPRRRDL